MHDLKEKGKKILYRHIGLYSTLYLINRKIGQTIHTKEKKIYEKCLQERRKLDIFAFRELAQPLPDPCLSLICENDLYGNQQAILNLLKQKTLRGYVEHGLYLGKAVPERIKYLPFRNVYTFGAYREAVLKEFFEKNGLNKKVIKVGPYILGAEKFFPDEKIASLKARNGKTLLFFPSHSIDGVDALYEIDTVVNHLRELKRDYRFKTVMVCMYWKDILEKRYEPYRDAGFQIVSAGHLNDIDFLGRLRTIIDLSDVTSSNQVGTHLGYCIALGKPHYLVSQQVRYVGEKVEKEFDRGDRWQEIYRNEKMMFENLFGQYRETITKEQLEVVKHYWGEF